ncbi:MAG: ComF family protein [Bacteroidales bacterium]|nr:ComF family protein [Bacteroidales bacterium]
MDCEAVTASVFFREGNTTQTMLHNIKYRGEIGLAHTMGRFMGEELAASHRFDGVELLVPVPLHRRKQRRRGYNQSLELCRGIAESFPRPISVDNLVRTVYTESQTHKSRIDRMANMEGVFAVRQPELFAGRHLLLVDDVMTTGATVEAACQPLLAIDGVRVSIATLAVAGDY